MRYIKILTLALGLVLLSGLTFVGIANAQSFKTGDSVSVPAGETVNSMLFAGGDSIDIAGIINGDVYCGGQTITISGTINGDVFCAGQTISVSGKIDGSVRLAGQSITISGTVGNSATVAAQDLIVEKGAVITRDLLGGSQNVVLNGEVGRDVVSGTKSLTVNGKIGRNINGGLEALTVGSGGVVGGKVDYIGTNDPTVIGDGKIVGPVTRTAPKDESMTADPFALEIGWFIYGFMAMLAVAMVFAGLFPRILEESAAETITNPGKTALVGFLAIILAPAAVFMLMLTVVGIPLAILTILIWIVIMFLVTPFAGYLLGKAFMRNPMQNPLLTMLLGASTLIVSYFVPIVGLITVTVAYIFGTGMILRRSKHLLIRPAIKK